MDQRRNGDGRILNCMKMKVHIANSVEAAPADQGTL
jgi:hypothetical protein